MGDPRKIVRHLNGRDVEYVRADIATAMVHGIEHQALDLGHDLVRERKAVEAERDRYRAALEEIRDQDSIENVLDPQWSARIADAALNTTTDAQEGEAC
jgi:hypothetical protein